MPHLSVKCMSVRFFGLPIILRASHFGNIPRYMYYRVSTGLEKVRNFESQAGSL